MKRVKEDSAMKDLLSRDLSDSEPIWHWFVWCIIGLVDVSGRRIPTVILMVSVFVLYAFVAHPACVRRMLQHDDAPGESSL